MKKLSYLIILIVILGLVLTGCLSKVSQVPATEQTELPQEEKAGSFNVTSLGFRANEGGGGALDTKWTGGNLGNTWAEGEWVPYQLVLTNVQTGYPSSVSTMPDIEISYDFTAKGHRFIDLVRGLQVGTIELTDLQGWPDTGGLPYSMATREQIEAAQNGDSENVWSGFTLLGLPNSQINRALDGSEGTVTDDCHKFIIYAADLIAAGIAETDDTIIIYYQLHESRTFIWNNHLQSGYDATPTDAWGGYLYGTTSYLTDERTGSGYVPGASGHVHVETLTGSQDVPIPIPEKLPGAVSGLKWLDINGNAVMDEGETTLSGWRIHVYGNVDNIPFSHSILTNETGSYSFPDLTVGTSPTLPSVPGESQKQPSTKCPLRLDM
jgi:hypothetical protein